MDTKAIKTKSTQKEWKHFDEGYDFFKKNEDIIPHLYIDSEGKPTIGVGQHLESFGEFNKMPLKDEYGNSATETQKAVAWKEMQTIKNNKANYNENGKFKYSADNFPGNQNLTISEEDADEYGANYMRGEIHHLREKFKDFDSHPKEVQIVLMDIQCNIGNTKFNRDKWPNLFEALEQKDYKRAAQEVNRKGVHDERNKESKERMEKGHQAYEQKKREMEAQKNQNPKSDQNESKDNHNEGQGKADTNPQQENQSESNNEAPREAKGDGVYRDDEDHSPPKEDDTKKEKPKAKKPSDKKLLRMMTTEDAASLISKKKSIAEVIKDIAKREGLILGDVLTEEEEKSEIGNNHTIAQYRPGEKPEADILPADGKIKAPTQNFGTQNRLHDRPIRGLLGDVLDDEDEVGSLLRPPRRPRRANTETLERRGKRVYRVGGPKGPRGSFYSGW